MIFIVIAPLIVAAFIGAFYKQRKKLWLTIISITLLTNIAYCFYALLIKPLPFEYSLGQWGANLGITLIFSKITVVFLLVWNFLFLAVTFYCNGEDNNTDHKFYILLLILLFAISGWTVTEDLYNMFVFIEIVSITSYALVSYKRTRESLEASIKYLIAGSVGSILILISVFIIYFNTGELNFALAMTKFSEIDLSIQFVTWSMLLVGFFSKTGAAPMHFWLPDAHANAKTGVSALLSGIVIKLNVISLYKLKAASNLAPELSHAITTATLLIGGISVIIGHLVANKQTNIKRLLAYSSIAQIGYIIMGLSYSIVSKTGALYHIVNHAILKSALFFSTGFFAKYNNSLDIEKLRGTGRKNPLASITFTVAALGIIGIPPLNGFSSKWTIMKELLAEQSLIISLIIPLGTILATLYYFKVFTVIFDTDSSLPDIRFSSFKVIALTLIIFAIITTSILAPFFILIFGA